MSEKQAITERVIAIAASVARDHGVEFVHAELLGAKRESVLRIFIDKDGGVSVGDCARFSASVEGILDSEDLIPWAYVLEVSSPGIERELYTLADFVRFSGELARLKTLVEVNGQKNFSGRIAAVEEGDIVLDDVTSGRVKIPYEQVAKANLKIDLAKELKGR
jgi:ribosome maturation factor RimP